MIPIDPFHLAAGVLFAFVALCVGCVLWEKYFLQVKSTDEIIAEALPDYEANINARWQG